jgi:hypothetical protein
MSGVESFKMLVFTKAKVADNKVLDSLLHGEEHSVHGDKAHTSNEHKLLASSSSS